MTYSRRQLEALGEPLGECATKPKVGGGYICGGGGSSAPAATSSTVTQTNIPDWLRPQVETVLGGATKELFTTQQTPGSWNPYTEQYTPGSIEITGTKPFTPYSQNPSDYVAPFSGLQQQSFQGAANLQTPGQIGVGSQMAAQAGMGGLGVAQQAGAFGAQAAGLAPQAQAYGQNAANIGGMGLGAMQTGAAVGNAAGNIAGQSLGYGAQAAGLAPAAQMYGQQAANIGGMGLGAMQTGAAVGNMATNLAAQQAGAGQQYASQATSPDAMQAYMSPYMQNVVQAQQQEAQRQADIANQSMAAQATQQGAFGGGRFAVQQAQSAANLARLKNSIQAQGLQSAFGEAQKAQQFGANLGLQGLSQAQQGLGNVLQGGQLGISGIQQALAGQQARLAANEQARQAYGMGLQGTQAAQQGLSNVLQGGQLGLAGVDRALAGQQAGLAGLEQARQAYGAGLQGTQASLVGYGLAGQAGATLGDLGQKELAAQQSVLAAQNQYGAQQQQQQQSIINQAIQNFAMAQQAPLERLQQYNALLRGYALPGTTAIQYQAAPPVTSQLAGLGIAGLGAGRMIGNKRGGVISEGIPAAAIRRASGRG